MSPTGANMLEKLGVVPLRHPRGEECAAVVKGWVTEHSGLGGRVSERKLAAWQFAALCSLMYPRCGIESAVLAACFTHWIAVVDDVVEALPDRTAEIRLAHETGRGGGEWGPVVEAWRDVEGRLVSGTGDAFRTRVNAAFGKLFDAYAWEADVRRAGRLPTLEELVTYRHASGGLPLYLLILERGVGGPLASSVVETGWFSELGQLVGNLTCFANDLLSFDWDRNENNPVNLTRVLSEGAEPDYERVEGYFVREWRRMGTLIDAARARVSAESTPAAYLDALPSIVTGVFTWMDETRRYAKG